MPAGWGETGVRDDYRYVIELFRANGEAVGQVALTPDWEPAVECARLAGLRSFGVWAVDSGAEHSVEPLWHTELGEPYVARFRVHLKAGGDREWFEDFPALRYFADAAREAAARLIESGALAKGDTVRYRPAAFRRPVNSAAASLSFDAAEAPTPLALRSTVLAGFLESSVVCGTVNPQDFEVLVPRWAVDEAAALTRAAGARETGGVLIGHLHQDPITREIFAEVTAQIPARHTQGDSVKLTFTSDTWTDVRSAIALRHREEMMLGWWHSHPAIEWCKNCPPERQRVCQLAKGFVSADDRALHRAILPRAFGVALVMTNALTGVTATLFGWRSGLLEPRGFRLLGDHLAALEETASQYGAGSAQDAERAEPVNADVVLP